MITEKLESSGYNVSLQYFEVSIITVLGGHSNDIAKIEPLWRVLNYKGGPAYGTYISCSGASVFQLS